MRPITALGKRSEGVQHFRHRWKSIINLFLKTAPDDGGERRRRPRKSAGFFLQNGVLNIVASAWTEGVSSAEHLMQDQAEAEDLGTPVKPRWGFGQSLGGQPDCRAQALGSLLLA